MTACFVENRLWTGKGDNKGTSEEAPTIMQEQGAGRARCNSGGGRKWQDSRCTFEAALTGCLDALNM